MTHSQVIQQVLLHHIIIGPIHCFLLHTELDISGSKSCNIVKGSCTPIPVVLIISSTDIATVLNFVGQCTMKSKHCILNPPLPDEMYAVVQRDNNGKKCTFTYRTFELDGGKTGKKVGNL